MSNTEWRKCVLLGDSKEYIKRIPDNSIDLILTDPPYNIGKHSTGNIPLPGRAAMNNDVADWDWTDFNPEEWAEEFIRILKPTGNLFIFTSYNQIGRWYDCLDHRFDTTNFMIWHKTNPAPKIYKAGFLNSCEMVFTCWNKKHTWNFLSQAEMHNFLESPICMRPERLNNPKHPAQKPVKILEKMITIASHPNDIVFDPFMGVGSCGVAALRKGRRYIGIEIDPAYYEAAKKRINAEINNSLWSASVEEETALYGTATKFFDISILADNRKEEAVHVVRKPIIKWAGGKEKELGYIMANCPKLFRNYYEPFVGGGAVFMTIDSKRAYINDLSAELISLYRSIQEQNKDFFLYAYSIDAAWKNAYSFFIAHPELTTLYFEYRDGKIEKNQLQERLSDILGKCDAQVCAILGKLQPLHIDVLRSELPKTLLRKMTRMRELELKKGELPHADINDNIQTAIKGALYMYFRYLYNDADLSRNNPYYACALFLFIRNYAYSGMFRYNAKGLFNVPYGGIGYNSKSLEKKLQYYQNPSIARYMASATIQNLDFEQFMRQAQPTAEDFVFLDPPYDSEFSTYSKNAFTKADHERLAHYFINECPAKWMLIIKNTDFIYSLYAGKPGIKILMFDKEYNVSFMNRNDKRATHLLITNY